MPFTDLPEGQTHYQNDGCGCPEHNETQDSEENTMVAHGDTTHPLGAKCRFCDKVQKFADENMPAFTHYTQIIPCPECQLEQGHSPECQTIPAKLYREVSELLSFLYTYPVDKGNAELILRVQKIKNML